MLRTNQNAGVVNCLITDADSHHGMTMAYVVDSSSLQDKRIVFSLDLEICFFIIILSPIIRS